LTLVLALALAAAPGSAFAQERLRVVTTSADLKSIADAIGGDRVECESLASPEQDPHAIELKPSQLARARAATLLIRVGLDHEPWLGRMRIPESVHVLDVSRTVRLIQTETPRLRAERRAHTHAYGNTHYWLDPENALPIAGAIRQSLGKLKPEHAAAFDRNHDAFVARLRSRVEAWKKALAPYRGAKVVVVHDSWSYFAERFGLQIVAAAEPQPGVPPSPAELATLFERMRESAVKIVIADPHSNPSLVRQIATRTGAHAVTLRPSGSDYIRLLDENVSTLAAGLKQTKNN
jgi:ABC-type Zn uptake system ZnuABC Zn-binding protein ZnuA